MKTRYALEAETKKQDMIAQLKSMAIQYRTLKNAVVLGKDIEAICRKDRHILLIL